jgi:DNA processing protein
VEAAPGPARVGVALPRYLPADHAGFPKAALRVNPQPRGLWADGDLGLLARPAVAIVGSRNPSPYGTQVAFDLARDLAEAGVVVVSGAARGLDARAHEGALAANGGTIAVLGTGIDVAYPAENADLIGRIRRAGLVLSELKPGVPPRPWTFPARNRIICALVRCLVVVEGRAKGGTSNSVEWASQLGVPVAAIPGRIDEPLAEGPNLLLQQGAHLILSADDVLGLMGLPARASQQRRRHAAATHRARAALTGAEATLYDLLTTQPVHVDTLAERSRLEPGLLLAALSSLELQGLVQQLPGKHFAVAA